MDGLNGGLLHAVVTIALGLVLWGLVAIPATIIRFVLNGFGLSALPARIGSLANRFGVTGGLVTAFFSDVQSSVLSYGGERSVELAVIERNERLRHALTKAEQGFREASQGLSGMEAAGAPGQLIAEIRQLQARTEKVENVGADFDEDIVEQYTSKPGTWFTIAMLVIGSVAVVILNGALLAQFFKELVTNRLLGIPVGQIIAYVLVFAEFLLGTALSAAKDSKSLVARIVLMVLLVAIVLAMMVVEYVAFSAFSANIDPEFYLNNNVPRQWLGVLGPAFVGLDVAVGFMLHGAVNQVLAQTGAKRLMRELNEAREFVQGLPVAWTTIATRATTAQNSVQRYLDELGGRDGQMRGLIEKISIERDQLVTVVRSVEVGPDLFEGKSGDIGRDCGRAVGSFMLACLWLVGFCIPFSLFSAAALHVPLVVGWFISLGTATGFGLLGRIALGRVQRLNGDRLDPLSASPLMLLTCAVGLTGVLLAMCWLLGSVLGPAGIGAGVLVTALCAPFLIIGHNIETVTRGGMFALTTVGRLTWATICAVFSCLRYALLWILAALAWLVSVTLALIAAPVELVMRAFKKRSEPNDRPPLSPRPEALMVSDATT